MLFALPDKSVDYRSIEFYEETKVKFSELSESMLWDYIDSGEPMWVWAFKMSVAFDICGLVMIPDVSLFWQWPSQVRILCVCLFVRDKAGGYGIQALGGMLVEYVHGDFLNVVGFPLNHFCKQLDAVFNSYCLSPGEEILSLSETNVSTCISSRSCRPEPDPVAATSLRSSDRPDLSSASYFNQTHGSQNSPSASPVHKVGSPTLWAPWRPVTLV